MTALLEIENVSRVFHAGDDTITALAGVSLSIAGGELVAIVGASGSGKTTLMNILGCLDQPSSGDYRIGGRSVAGLTADNLAGLRRKHFGFIFQHYQLLGTLNAAENVAMPAVYAGLDAGSRRERSTSLLRRLGLGDRLDHRPNQLSGGQQQRVSIARALMNGGRIILADEPTGALDRKSGETVLDTLKELHTDGHTIIIVTHDMEIASHADRIIEMRDGVILCDRRTRDHNANAPLALHDSRPVGSLSAFRRRLVQAFPMAIRSMTTDRVRTFLTMLSIIIGIAAVVAAVGFGEGARQNVLRQLGGLGASTLQISPGRHFGDDGASSIKTLVVSDADALAHQSYVDSVTPKVRTSAQIGFGHTSVAATVTGVGQDYLRVNALELLKGSFFSAGAISERSQEAVINDTMAATLFPNDESPLGNTLLIGRVPVLIIGVFATPPAFRFYRELEVLLPYTAVKGRLEGADSSLDGLTVRVAGSVDTIVAERAVVDLITRRHGTKDFIVENQDQRLKSVERSSQAMWRLTSSMAAISLLVGGIGVMNMMLISVTERTREIGLRMAVGARRIDIMLQFLIEAVTMCIAGSVLGVALALGIATVLGGLGSEFAMIISVKAIVAACAVALWIGLTFGFLPARNASRLTPVDALSRD
ncbi:MULTISPECIES: MacB family efflux pump subunit [Mesorhizobium]|uniref:Pyoverdine export ATP-binding/permease protein PvdT n=1 Tax=Mesorhizobium neociceri TaxID=1307853 RepID=A0A838B8Z4_9HYPH|nr:MULTISPECIES: MacB family efflux pump subunit [Mesorhizobium]MBA1142441.1 MacB family efflux pump subunit [Mesorhizobium neociceri]